MDNLTIFDFQTNNYKELRSRIGNFCYNLLKISSRFLANHLWLYYILNYTWGIATVVFGWLIILFVNIFLRKKIVDQNKFGPCRYIMLGDNWGGLEMGINFFLADNMGESWTLHTKCHEMGHTFQNAVLGPFAIFLIYIPSAIRYWVQRLNIKLGHSDRNKPYDQIWFEESATDIGTLYYATYINKDIQFAASRRSR